MSCSKCAAKDCW